MVAAVCNRKMYVLSDTWARAVNELFQGSLNEKIDKFPQERWKTAFTEGLKTFFKSTEEVLDETFRRACRRGLVGAFKKDFQRCHARKL